MTSATITALATGLLVIVGLAQVGVLVAQRRQQALEFLEAYRGRWVDAREAWAATVFLGRDPGEYYQVGSQDSVDRYQAATERTTLHVPAVWALDSIRAVAVLLGDVCLKILHGQISVSDAYPIFGTELLRHSRPLRVLLEADYERGPRVLTYESGASTYAHYAVRKEVQDWLIYHDGTRRRCLILIDLLWAEAARLEDLPPSDLKSGADAKRKSGPAARRRLAEECVRLNGLQGILLARRLARFLRHAEYRQGRRRVGIDPKRLSALESEWVARLLRN